MAGRRKSSAPPPVAAPAPRRDRFEVFVWDETAGHRVKVSAHAERWQAERAATAKALQPGFSHGQVFDREDSE